MEKTKLGVSVILLSVLMYVLAWVGGSLSTLALAGYILLVEDNEQLKLAAKRATSIMVIFMLIPSLLGVITSITSWLSGFFAYDAMFESEEVLELFTNFNKFFVEINSILGILENIVFATIIVCIIMKKEVKIPVIDKLIEKYI